MRSATYLRFGLASAAFTAGVESSTAQITVEPLAGWTWEGRTITGSA
jgi:hypothetical protein